MALHKVGLLFVSVAVLISVVNLCHVADVINLCPAM